VARNSGLNLVVMCAIGVAFILGLAHLFVMRFQVGDVYPPYSSLRTDPLGAKAFYESLARLPNISVERGYQPPSGVEMSDKATVFYLGAKVERVLLEKMRMSKFAPRDVHDDRAKSLEALAAGGGRLVFTFHPLTNRPWIDEEPAEDRREAVEESEQETEEAAEDEEEQELELEEPVADKEEQQDDDDLDEEPPQLVSLDERWGFRFDFAALPERDGKRYRFDTAYRTTEDDLPDEISWHTILFFDELDDAWQVVYTRDDHPVIIERTFGAGTIVLSADSYFTSNQAMRDERYPDLLAWLVGPNTGVVFDETHLGVSETPGLAALARKYRLHGLLVALLLLAGLFVWKNAVSFVPPYTDEPVDEDEFAAERDFTAGLVNLSRRSIPRKEVLNVALDEWKKSVAHGRTDLTATLDRAQAILDEEAVRPRNERDPVRCYRRISRLLAEERKV